jgi:hypothetical protein
MELRLRPEVRLRLEIRLRPEIRLRLEIRRRPEIRLRPARRAGLTTGARRQTHSACSGLIMAVIERQLFDKADRVRPTVSVRSSEFLRLT